MSREQKVGRWEGAVWFCGGKKFVACTGPWSRDLERCPVCGTSRPEPATPSVAVPAEGEPDPTVAEAVRMLREMEHVAQGEGFSLRYDAIGYLAGHFAARPSAGGTEVTEPATWAVWCDGHVCYAPFRTEADAKERLKRCSWPIGENGGGYVAPLYAALASRVAPAAPQYDVYARAAIGREALSMVADYLESGNLTAAAYSVRHWRDTRLLAAPAAPLPDRGEPEATPFKDGMSGMQRIAEIMCASVPDDVKLREVQDALTQAGYHYVPSRAYRDADQVVITPEVERALARVRKHVRAVVISMRGQHEDEGAFGEGHRHGASMFGSNVEWMLDAYLAGKF